MGETAEILAKEFAISRENQDNFAQESHKKAFLGRDKLKEEMFSVFPDPDYPTISWDTGVREKANPLKFQKAKPYFDKKYGDHYSIQLLSYKRRLLTCPANG